MVQAIESIKVNCFRESMLKSNQAMKELDDMNKLSYVVNKALTQVGAFFL